MSVATGDWPALDDLHRVSHRAASRIARVQIVQDLSTVEPVWRALQRDGLTTPYQHFDFLAAWQRHVGPHKGITPFVVVGSDADGHALFLWPLGAHRTAPLRTAEFLGGTHANFNFALWRRDVVHDVTAADLLGVFRAIRDTGHGVDLLRLLRQPLSWEGMPNPFARLPHQPSVDDCTRLTLNGSGEDVLGRQLSPSMRARLRTKARKLQRLPGYRYLQAATAQDAQRLLAGFFPTKAAHMALNGLHNVFTEPGMEEFLRALCRDAISGDPPLIEIHALEANGEMLAFFAAITDGRRLSLMFNTYTLGDHARQSPGLILLTHVVASCADRGMQSFDLGVGEAGYKAFFCKEAEPMFDSFLPLTAAGRVAALGQRALYAAKRGIKTTPALYSALQRARRWLRGASPAA